MGLFTRFAAYWAMDYGLARAAGNTHKQAKKIATGILKFGIVLLLGLLILGMTTFEHIENKEGGTRYLKDCKAVGERVVCTKTLVTR